MRRLTAFERDLEDLHRVRVRPVKPETVTSRAPFPRDTASKNSGARRGVDHVGLRLTLGVLGLFWSIVLLGVLAAMGLVGWAFGSAFFTT